MVQQWCTASGVCSGAAVVENARRTYVRTYGRVFDLNIGILKSSKLLIELIERPHTLFSILYSKLILVALENKHVF